MEWPSIIATLAAKWFLTNSDSMNDELYNELLEASWRRKLTAEEEAQLRAWLVAHPEAQADWDEEALLTQQLERLPNAPLASNFTAQVMGKLELDLARE